MSAESLDTCTVQDLAQDCAKQASHRQASVDVPDPCYELFRRALSSPPDQDAWTAIENQFVNIGAVMGYLKRCTAAVRIEAWRQERQKLMVTLTSRLLIQWGVLLHRVQLLRML